MTRAASWRKRVRASAAWLLVAVATLASDCGAGDGGGGGPPVIEVGTGDPACMGLNGAFPPGFDLIPGTPLERVEGAVVQLAPEAVLGLDLSTVPPALLAQGAIPPLFPGGDSDGDGLSDGLASNAAGFGFRTALLGRLTAIGPTRALLSTTNYEQVAFVDPRTGETVPVRVETPASFALGAWPFLPPPGTGAIRTAVSTRVCAELAGAVDSHGDPVGSDARCPPAASGTSFATSLTAGSAVAAGRLFVATSNLTSSAQARFDPATVLVYELDLAMSPPLVRPHPSVPVLFPGGFNATQVTPYTTPSGRELVLVTQTGAIGAGTGAGNVFGDASVAAIDAAALRVVATIPLGAAGPSFEPIAIDASGRLGLLGSASQKVLFAVDLAPLDDAALYSGASGPPVVLDGTAPGLPDARVFTAAAPLALPDLTGGPPDTDCAGLTSVAAHATRPFAWATDFCDGTLTTLLVDAAGAPVPVPPDRVQIVGTETPFAPNVPSSIGLLRAPQAIRVRPGERGVDYEGPDVFVAVGLPDGAVCALETGS